MAENLLFSGSKKEKYEQFFVYCNGIVKEDEHPISNMANTAALLKQAFNWFWIGFYCVHHNGLILGPFQGPNACTQIAFGKGVCGTAWKSKSTVLVNNVHEFPGHIACNSASNSEIVVPILVNQKVIAVLDADSEFYSHFDLEDQHYLELYANRFAQCLQWSSLA